MISEMGVKGLPFRERLSLLPLVPWMCDELYEISDDHTSYLRCHEIFDLSFEGWGSHVHVLRREVVHGSYRGCFPTPWLVRGLSLARSLQLSKSDPTHIMIITALLPS